MRLGDGLVWLVQGLKASLMLRGPESLFSLWDRLAYCHDLLLLRTICNKQRSIGLLLLRIVCNKQPRAAGAVAIESRLQ